MSYLFPEGTATELGVLQVGANILVANSIISIPQSVATTANVTFDTINTSNFKLNGNSVVTSLVAGNNISISGSTGNITITATGSGIVTTVGVANNYTALTTDEYIGATANSVTITLPTGTTGKSYMIKNEGAGGSVTVSATGPDKIDGSPNKSLSNNASLSVIYRASQWRII